MKHRLPVLVERTIRDAYTARTELAARAEREIQTLPLPLTCQKGCHHCCYFPVSISIFEAISLFQWLSDEMIWNKALKAACEDHAAKTVGLSLEVWMLSLIPCPLLKDGLCTAYERRPFVCRVTASVGDPHNCHPHRIPDAEGLVGRREALQRLMAAEEPLRKRFAIGKLRVPLARALLVAERVCKGELELEDVGKVIWLDLKVNG